MPYSPQEYTPELTEEFYKRLARPIEEETLKNVGLARSEALARGMEGDPFEAIGVANAREAGTNALANLYANLGWQGAGWAREERLNREARDWQAAEQEKNRIWEANEREKARAFQEHLARLQYEWQKKLKKRSFWDYLGGMAGQAGGIYAGAKLAAL